MAIVPYITAPITGISRKVWVLNKYHLDYRENFKGREIVVPANEKKEVLMPVLEANRFLSRVAVPPTILPNGQYDSIPKALYLAEMTDEERSEKEGKTVSEIAKEKKSQEKLLMCALCGDSMKDKAGLKRHTTLKHPGGAITESEESEGDALGA